MFSGMYTSQGYGDILVRMCGSWEKIMIDQRRSRRILKQVKQCIMPFLCLLRLSHDLQAILNVLMHVDMFSGMYTSQGSGDILVRMCGRWEKIMVDQRRSRRILKQVKQCIMPFLCLLRLSHDLQAFLNVLMHVDMFSAMYTSQASGDILVRMCGSWEKIMVYQRRSRRILKQVKQCIMPFYAFCASHTTCRLL